MTQRPFVHLVLFRVAGAAGGFGAAAMLGLLMLVAGCGGGGAGGAVIAQAATAAPEAVATGRGSLLGTDWTTYPRVIRLSHQPGAVGNGQDRASLSERGASGWQPALYASSDDGASFEPLGTIADADFASGVCCGTLFELPRAVGALAEGTLLYATSVGYDVAGSLVANRVYASLDAGRTFSRLADADCGASAVPRVPGQPGSGVWEPEFLVAADGSLACIYSDETEPGKSQVLKLVRTVDGVRWSTPRTIVAGSDPNDRPGMAGVRRLPDGSFVMVFEWCSLSRLDCSARLRRSSDGLDWGDPADPGQRPQTAEGRYFRHTPTLAWTPLAGSPEGRLVMTGQLLASDAAGVDSADTGRVLMVSSSGDGTGDWRMVNAPVALPAAPAQSNWCQNYSSPLLPSADGNSILMLQSDSADDGGCQTRFGRGGL